MTTFRKFSDIYGPLVTDEIQFLLDKGVLIEIVNNKTTKLKLDKNYFDNFLNSEEIDLSHCGNQNAMFTILEYINQKNSLKIKSSIQQNQKVSYSQMAYESFIVKTVKEETSIKIYDLKIRANQRFISEFDGDLFEKALKKMINAGFVNTGSKELNFENPKLIVNYSP